MTIHKSVLICRRQSANVTYRKWLFLWVFAAVVVEAFSTKDTNVEVSKRADL